MGLKNTFLCLPDSELGCCKGRVACQGNRSCGFQVQDADRIQIERFCFIILNILSQAHRVSHYQYAKCERK
jgi:hypothetical protein